MDDIVSPHSGPGWSAKIVRPVTLQVPLPMGSFLDTWDQWNKSRIQKTGVPSYYAGPYVLPYYFLSVKFDFWFHLESTNWWPFNVCARIRRFFCHVQRVSMVKSPKKLICFIRIYVLFFQLSRITKLHRRFHLILFQKSSLTFLLHDCYVLLNHWCWSHAITLRLRWCPGHSYFYSLKSEVTELWCMSQLLKVSL